MRRTYLSCFMFLVFLVQLPENAAGAKCYACSYIFAGHDGVFGYSCVNDTSNFASTSQIECELPRKCIIKAVYDRNVQRLLSMDKGCQVPQGKTGCDAPDGIRPVCYYNCDTDLCNFFDGNLAFVNMPFPGKAAPTSSSGIYVTLMMAVLAAYTSV